MTNTTPSIDVEKVKTSIRMLKTYLDEAEIGPLLSLLEELQQHPEDDSILVRISALFAELGMTQGAVLTYAPYLNVILLDDPFANVD